MNEDIIRGVCHKPGHQFTLSGGRQSHQYLVRGLIDNSHSTRSLHELRRVSGHFETATGQLLEAVGCVLLNALFTAVEGWWDCLVDASCHYTLVSEQAL